VTSDGPVHGERARLTNGTVEVELERGTFTLRWPVLGVTLGPCVATATRAGSEHRSGDGTWALEASDGFGRAGTWARWRAPSNDRAADLSVELHVPSYGPAVIVTATFTATNGPATVDRVTPLSGTTDLAATRALLDGYDSWAYSGVRGREPVASWWDTVLVARDGRGLAFHALDAQRLATRIVHDDGSVRVECGATPPLTPVAGTWGYLVGDPPTLDLPLATGETLRSEPVAVAAGRDPLELAEDLASLAAACLSARRWSGAEPRGWESWYHYGLFVTADDVLANARVLRERYAARPDLDLVQIDDGWQRTYGAWWPNERFPDDLGTLVAELRGLGCRAGLWLAPFRVQPDAPGLATDHPDWCLRDADGELVREPRANAWALDASHPDAREWLRELGAQVREWGFEMVKVDFCYLGALAGVRHDRRVTGIEALRRGFGALVEGLGDGVYVLGCGMPVLPAVGICHANRVGHDLAMPRALHEVGHPLDEAWTGFAGVRAQARNVAARFAQATRWYDADPEVVMAWGADGADPAGYSLEEARTLATMVAVTGGPYLLADDLAALTDMERAVVEHPALLELIGRAPFRPFDLFDRADADDVTQHAFAPSTAIPRVWATTRDGARVVACFNWSDEPEHVPTPTGMQEAIELWTGTRAGPELEIPPHGVRVVRAP